MAGSGANEAMNPLAVAPRRPRVMAGVIFIPRLVPAMQSLRNSLARSCSGRVHNNWESLVASRRVMS